MSAPFVPLAEFDLLSSLEPDQVLKPRLVKPAAKCSNSAASSSQGLLMPGSAMYGKLGDHTRMMGTPLGWAYCSLLTIHAGQGPNLHQHSRIRPTLYTVLLGTPEDGKSHTMRECIGSVTIPLTHVKGSSPGSDRGLQRMFEQTDEKGKPTEPELRSYLLAMDEMRLLLSKMGIKGSGESLAATLCSLWNEDEAGSADKTGNHTVYARLSILTCLAVKDRDDFVDLFGSESQAGFLSRLILVPVEGDWEFDHQLTVPPQSYYPTSTAIPSLAYERVKRWRLEGAEEGIKRGRICEIALRVALLSSSKRRHHGHRSRDGSRDPLCRVAGAGAPGLQRQ